MASILLLLFVGVLLFFTTLWPVKKAAGWWETERSSYGVVAIALAVSLLTTLLAQIILQRYLSPLPLFGGSLVITAGIFASVLGTTFVRGLGITVVSNLIGVVVVTIVILVISASGIGIKLLPDALGLFGDGKQQAATIEEAVNQVCDCEYDNACLQERFAQVIILIAQQGESGPPDHAEHQLERARACINLYRVRNTDSREEPAPTVEPATPVATIGTAEDTAPATTDAVETPDTPDRVKPPALTITTPHKKRWSYQRINVAEAKAHVDETVRLTRKDNGKVIEGILAPQQAANSVAITQHLYGGTFTMQVPKAQIRKLELRVSTTP